MAGDELFCIVIKKATKDSSVNPWNTSILLFMQLTSYNLPSRKVALSKGDTTSGVSFRQTVVQDQATSARLHNYIGDCEGYDSWGAS